MDIILFGTSFFETTTISILEAIMLICFGMSWPASIIKTLRTKIVSGKSPLFMSLIIIGYISGISHKVLYSRDYLILLYVFNLSLILTDLYLYKRYNQRENEKATNPIPQSEKSEITTHTPTMPQWTELFPTRMR